jgi:hypothetical protein
MKKIGLSLGFIILIMLAFAQPKIQFDNSTYDFNTIKEAGGKVTGRFDFTNAGDSALVLIQVKPGCGCTAANYTKDPIPPGGRGYIEATYDPYNRPGSFYKNIKVTTNEPAFSDPNTSPHIIIIKGYVEKREPTVFETAGYTQGKGMVRIKEKNGKMELLDTEMGKITFLVRNFLEKESKCVPINLPDYFTIETPSFKNTLKPNQEAEIIINFYPQKKNQYGFFREVITFETDDTIEPKLTYLIDLHVKEDFSKYTKEQLKKAPVTFVNVDTNGIDFGKLQLSATQTKQITITNKGKSQLIIRQLIADKNNLFTVTNNKNILQPEESDIITVTFKARRSGIQRSTIDLITNDPVNPIIVINLIGEVSQ